MVRINAFQCDFKSVWQKGSPFPRYLKRMKYTLGSIGLICKVKGKNLLYEGQTFCTPLFNFVPVEIQIQIVSYSKISSLLGMALSLYTTLCHTSLNFFLHKENFVCTGMKSTVNTFLYEFFVVQSRGDPIQALRGSLQSKLGRWVGGRMPDIIEQNFPLRTKLLSSKSNTLNANKMKIEWPQY